MQWPPLNASTRHTGITTLFTLLALLSSTSAIAAKSEWLHFGQDAKNQRNQAKEKILSPKSVGEMQVKWNTDLGAAGGGDVWTTPAMDQDHLYFPDSAGFLYRMKRNTGEVVWRKPISDYSSKPTSANNFSRTTPAVSGKTLIIGDQANRFPFYYGPMDNAIGAEVMAVNKITGEKIWSAIVDNHPYSIITTSPTIHDGKVLVGVSSYESAYALHVGFGVPFIDPSYQPSFKGSLVALDLETGDELWRRFTTIDGFSGASVWGSAPSIDEKRNQVFIGTGQNFSMPDDVKACAQAAYDNPPVDGTWEEEARACFDNYPDNHFDSIMALDLDTGAVNWSNRVIGYDTWHVACLAPYLFPPSLGQELFTLCPNPTGTDADFGQSPILLTLGGNKGQDVVGVGQKSGQYWLMDAETGDTIWSTKVSPGGTAGGIQWGSAYDGERIYTSSANSNNIPWELTNGETAYGGIWSALDPETGDILWQTADPNNAKSGGAVSVANGVVYVCSWDDAGTMYALNASNGETLWSHASGGICNSGAAIGDGQVFWGSGYESLGAPAPAKGMWSFGLTK